MSFTAEGTVEIDLCDFNEWILDSCSKVGIVRITSIAKQISGSKDTFSIFTSHGRLPFGPDSVYVWGPPRVNKSNQTLEIDFAMDDFGNDPAEWTQKPNALKQWKDLNKTQQQQEDKS